jgi:hypothetical protein
MRAHEGGVAATGPVVSVSGGEGAAVAAACRLRHLPCVVEEGGPAMVRIGDGEAMPLTGDLHATLDRLIDGHAMKSMIDQ